MKLKLDTKGLMKNMTKTMLALAVLITQWNYAISGERLSSTMGEVLLRNLQPGATYQLTSLLSFPLKITYEGENPVALLVTPALPEPSEMKEGYQPVPDLNWVSVSPSQFEVKGSSVMETNISISIPNDDSLLGKKFIVYIWARTASQSGALSMGLGTKSRLLISIAKEKAEGPAMENTQSYMNFKLEPGSITLENVKPGAKLNLGKILKTKFYIQNQGAEKKAFALKKVSGESLEMRAPQGMEWGPETTELEIKSENLKVRARGRKRFNIRMKIPDEPASYGKRFQYLIRVSPEGIGMTSGILFRINVQTEQQK